MTSKMTLLFQILAMLSFHGHMTYEITLEGPQYKAASTVPEDKDCGIVHETGAVMYTATVDLRNTNIQTNNQTKFEKLLKDRPMVVFQYLNEHTLLWVVFCSVDVRAQLTKEKDQNYGCFPVTAKLTMTTSKFKAKLMQRARRFMSEKKIRAVWRDNERDSELKHESDEIDFPKVYENPKVEFKKGTAETVVLMNRGERFLEDYHLRNDDMDKIIAEAMSRQSRSVSGRVRVRVSEVFDGDDVNSRHKRATDIRNIDANKDKDERSDIEFCVYRLQEPFEISLK